jgi:ABC-type multidrug transport system fused ATPase/permease subunit
VKSKPKHGIFTNTVFSLNYIWKGQKSLIFWAAVEVVMQVLFPFVGILSPRIVIDEIVAQVEPSRFILVVGILALALVVINFLFGYSSGKIESYIGNVANAEFTVDYTRKLITMDFANRERPDFFKLSAKANRNLSSWSESARYVVVLTSLLANVGGLLLYGGIIATIHPLIIVLLMISVVINGFLQRWHRQFDEARREAVGENNKKVWHIRWMTTFKHYAKDIRIFNMYDWLVGRLHFHLDYVRRSDSESSKRGLAAGVVDSFMVLIRDGGAYAFLTYLLLSDQIGLGEFVMLFAAIGGMAGWISGILNNSTSLFRASVEVSDRRELLDYPDTLTNSGGVEIYENAPEIKLENISYTYPAQEDKENEPTLKNVNLTIKAGEKLAIVGVNGAGKTTLVKLLCGFYQPNEGAIYANGVNIKDYNRDEYLSTITAVFQQSFLLAEDISSNVSHRVPDETDDKKVIDCLKKSGLWEKVKELEKGVNTMLTKVVDDDAIELSGGELQKLALARALYKDAPLLILDEPTAALDPIAENNMYQEYATLTEGKTSVYISHRLASTRFCDRIILLDGNTLAEVGTHDQLMAQNGKYAEMFNLQASYYREESK